MNDDPIVELRERWAALCDNDTQAPTCWATEPALSDVKVLADLDEAIQHDRHAVCQALVRQLRKNPHSSVTHTAALVSHIGTVRHVADRTMGHARDGGWAHVSDVVSDAWMAMMGETWAGSDHSPKLPEDPRAASANVRLATVRSITRRYRKWEQPVACGVGSYVSYAQSESRSDWQSLLVDAHSAGVLTDNDVEFARAWCAALNEQDTEAVAPVFSLTYAAARQRFSRIKAKLRQHVQSAA